MADVCVITGGGSGMGLAAAKYMPADKIVVVTGRTLSKLEKAVEEIENTGRKAYAKTCDTSDRQQVKELAEFASGLGTVKNVINSAGLSPAMAGPEKLLRVNALGTVYINEEFSKVMKDGGVIVDVSSNSAYMMPDFLVSKRTFALAEKKEERFIKKILALCKLIPKEYYSSGIAYAISKKFVIWYAAKCAFEYGDRKIRVCSVSPGLIATDMGKLESGVGGGLLLGTTAERRMGTPEELGFAIATAADERNGYLAGVDILCDGGSVKGKRFRK